MARKALVLACVLALATGSSAMSPFASWLEYANAVRAALQLDPWVTLTLTGGSTSDLAGPKAINIAVSACPAASKSCPGRERKAQALATLLAPALAADRTTQGFKVALNVTYNGKSYKAGTKPTSGAEAVALLRAALLGNRYFSRVQDYVNDRFNLGNDYYYFLFKPAVVQYLAVSASSEYNPFVKTATAQEVFTTVFNLPAYAPLAIRPSTESCKDKYGCLPHLPNRVQ